MLKSWTIVIAVHALVATAAIVLGAYNLIRKVKGDAVHKAIGRTWCILMLTTAFSAFFIGGYSDFVDILLHALAVWTIISIASGIYFARMGNISAHRGFMSGSYYGLVGALIGVVAVPSRRIPSWFNSYPLQMICITLFVIAIAWFYIYITHKRVTPKLTTLHGHRSEDI